MNEREISMTTSTTVLTSGIWQLSSVIVESEGQCLVVDPAFFPRELAELRAAVDARGRAVAVAFTHVHWDHVVGWQTFPEADVWASAPLARAIERGGAEADASLARARDFDARWYVDRAQPLSWPRAARGLADGDVVRVGALTVRALSLPGHTADGLGLLVEEERTLLLGDHLSPCEIPFVENLPAYRATLRRLLGLLDQVDSVIPGHGPRLSRERARRIADEDLDYLEKLARAVAEGGVEAALSVRLPRAADVPEMRDHHRDNCIAAARD